MILNKRELAFTALFGNGHAADITINEVIKYYA